MDSTLTNDSHLIRFDALVAEWYEAADRGDALDRDEWVAQHPQFAAEFSQFFAGEDLVNLLAPPRSNAPRNGATTRFEATLADVLDAPQILKRDPDATVSESPRPGAGSLGGEVTKLETHGATRSRSKELSARRIGDYELIRRLGGGGMGDVYEARQLRLNRHVALKMIRSGALATEEDVQRFRNEAEAVALLDHPRIVTIHEVGEDSGWHYFSMKLFRGGTLNDRLKRFQSDPRAAATVMIEVARAIQYAHEKGILHRDLKPANILIDENGQPHVSDFGLAKRLGHTSDLTGTGAILGTPAYMAPEQAFGSKAHVTSRSDVYGLGAVLYALLTGRAPYIGKDAIEIIDQVRDRDRDPDPPSKIQPKVSRDLETICLKALDKDPRHRYASAEDLAADLRRWLDGEPIEARSISPLGRAWMWSRRHWNIAATMAGLSVLSGVSSWQWFRAEGHLRTLARASCSNDIDRAIETCENGEVGRGLLLFAEALKNAPGDSEDLKQAIRANIVAWAPYATRLRALLPHDGEAYHVAYAPDGRTLVTACTTFRTTSFQRFKGQGALLWSGSTNVNLIATLAHAPGVTGSEFTPDGLTVATYGLDGTTRFWRASDGQPSGTPLQHGGQLLCYAQSPDGRTLLTGSTDNTARLWDSSNSKPTGEPIKHPNWPNSVTFLLGGRVAVTACDDGKVRLYDVSSLALISDRARVRPNSYDMRPKRIVGVCNDGSKFITNATEQGTREYAAQVWDGATGAPMGPALRHEAEIRAVAIDGGGNIALTGSTDKTARLWDIQNGVPHSAPLRHQSTVRCVYLNESGTLAVTGTEDGTVQAWDVEKSAVLGDPMRHVGHIVQLAVHPSGREIASASVDRTVRIWRLTTSLQPIHAETDDATFAESEGEALSPDKSLLLVGSSDGTGRVRDAQTMFEKGAPLQHDHEVMSVAWSTDGRKLLTGCTDGKVRVWWADSRQLIVSLTAHQGAVRSVAFSRDSQTFLTGGDDGKARLWATDSGKPIGPTLQHDSNVVAVSFQGDAEVIATKPESGPPRRWELPALKPGSDDRFEPWVSLITGSKIADTGAVVGLDIEHWRTLKQRLDKAGGPPTLGSAEQ